MVKFDFNNMFAYGEGNKINFDRCNGVVGIFSPNASGKSSVLDALTFCLFDRSTRAYKAENIMNNNCSTFKCKVEFEIGNETYFIERFGRIQKNGTVRVEVNFTKVDENGEKSSLNGDQRASTNKAIRSVIGVYEDFLLTSFSSQNNNSVFLDKNQTEKKEILDTIQFRIQSVLRGQNSKYVLMNAPNDKIDGILKLLPGMRSPTVLPLAEEGWSSIHTVITKDKFWDVIDDLKSRGAEGILVCPIEKMVI